jgi:hypothetical protein
MDTGVPRSQDDPLARPAASLRGVGPERSAQLARLGIVTIGDLTRDYSLIERARGIGAAGLAGGNCGIVGQATVARACSAAWQTDTY